MSDTAWIALGNIVATLAGAFALWLKLREQSRARAEEARKAAAEARRVKETLHATTAATAEKLNDMAAVGRRTELYCNSALGRALRVAAVATAAVAMSDPTPENVAAAAVAAGELAEHEAKQRRVDAVNREPHETLIPDPRPPVNPRGFEPPPGAQERKEP